MRKIVAACDSFKGSLSSMEAGQAIAAGVREMDPDCEVAVCAVSDGGEGLTEALAACWPGKKVERVVHDPLMRPVRATYLSDGQRAVIELAAASGLPLLSSEERNPLVTTTFGTGELVLDAVRSGCRHIVLGVGGSATNDAGTGLLRALGVRFFDSSGNEVPEGGGNLERIVRIDTEGMLPELAACTFELACDVESPMTGPEGASYLFARQKGADDEEIRILERGMLHFAQILTKSCAVDLARLPRSGAAGGTGGGMAGVVHATLRSGIELVLDAIRFEDVLRGANLVLTGEGRLDCQMMMGKAPWGVMQRARHAGIPVVAIGGSVTDCDRLCEAGFRAVLPIQQGPIGLEEAMARDLSIRNIRRTAGQIVRIMTIPSQY